MSETKIPDGLQALVDKKLDEAIDYVFESMLHSPQLNAMREIQSLLYDGEITPNASVEMIRQAQTLPMFRGQEV